VYEVAQYESWILSLFQDLPDAKQYAESRAIEQWDGYDTLPEVDAVVLKHPDYSIGDDDYLPYIKTEPVETITYDDDSNGDEDSGDSPDPFGDIAEIFECDREFVEDMAEVAFGDSADEAGDGDEQ